MTEPEATLPEHDAEPGESADAAAPVETHAKIPPEMPPRVEWIERGDPRRLERPEID